MQLRLQPDLETALNPGVVLSAGGDAAVTAHARPARADLALNPVRFKAWERYAGGALDIITSWCS